MSEGGRQVGPVVLLKRGLLLFWAAWQTLVFTTNVLDGAKALAARKERSDDEQGKQMTATGPVAAAGPTGPAPAGRRCSR